jgi:ABC-2 type transport system ATP-binding protein
VIADGTPAELKARAGRDVIEVHTQDADGLQRAATALRVVGPDEPAVDVPTRRVAVAVDAGTAQLMTAARALDDAGVAVEDLGLRRPTLDEVFLALTGRGADEHDDTEARTA